MQIDKWQNEMADEATRLELVAFNHYLSTEDVL